MKGQPELFSEIIVDNFAGGGGASTGIELATGRIVDIAINHDADAILMHKTNHPYTEHYQESVWDIDPIKVCRGRPVGLAWFSPDCKHFSKAKGGKPVEKSIRGLAWIVLRWAGKVRPRVIILENVEEFVTWGPVRKGRPVKQKAGQTFQRWVSQLEALEYKVEWKELKACDYGAPTIRKRFFCVARCDGRPISWPTPTHGDPKSQPVKSGKLKPWRTAAEIIDWSIPCPSIFERKKPLAENTMKRIARGLKKFVLDNPSPFIVQVNHGGDGFRGQDIHDPLQTVTAKNGYGIVTPYTTKFQQNSTGQVLGKPLDTVMAGATRFGLIAPSLIQYHSEKSPNEIRGQGIERPLLTQDVSNRYAITAATLIQTGYGEAPGQKPRVPGLDKPIGTIVSSGKHAVVSAFMCKHYGGGYTGAGPGPEDPVNTITTRDHISLVTSHLIKMKGTNCGHLTDEPLQTITAGGLHFGEVRAFLIKYYGQGVGQAVGQPLDTVVSKDRFGLVTVAGEQYQIADIGMRMLEPKELYAAQGFPADYIINRDYTGKAYPKSAQVARCGNAVCPPLAKALVAANLPEWCNKPAHNMEEIRKAVTA